MNNQYRTIWLSDIHLGCKDCKADFLLDFLTSHTADTLYLVGDIVDFWALSKRLRWPESHNKVLKKILQLSEQGTRVVYIPGNHDEVLRPYADMLFAGIEIHHEFIHQTISGKKMLLVHGDKYDGQVCLGKWQAKLGDVLYDFLLFLNRQCQVLRRTFGLPYWSLASFIKTKVKSANEAIARYQQAAVKDAKQQDTDAIICGHIHHPKLTIDDGVLYCNDGDWIESCTSLAETQKGEIQLLRWNDQLQTSEVMAQANWGQAAPVYKEQAA